jgi:hypothetical protein
VKNPERMLTLRLKAARGLMRELIDLADLQGWSYRPKEDGLLFSPPKAIVRPGFELLFASDPGNDSHRHKQLKDRFRKAGMKFPEDEPVERKSKMSPAPPKTLPSAPANPFTVMRQKINAQMTILSEMEQELGRIEAEYGKFKALGEALKSFSAIQ